MTNGVTSSRYLECDVVVTRDHSKTVIDQEGKRRIVKTPGEPVDARFIVPTR